ncbi:MAG: penicillin-binding transpeptidase domain-containing protein [Bacilli bacterium]|nr:penicillin-binding transpeptidase domain-containing protein [Bacilli bacterium]
MFLRNIDKRIKIILVITILLFSFVVIRVGYIQVVEYQKLNKLAKELWNRNLPIEANRGIIYDRNGIELATNLTTTSLILIPNQIKDKERVTLELSKILNISYEKMLKHVSKRVSIERVHPEGRRLTYDIADKINSFNFDGVYLVKEAKRYYPHNTILSHVLGFVGIDNQGLGGIELIYDEYLTGETGAIKYIADAKGNKLMLSEEYQKPQDGMNIMLTIDYEIQKSIERELDIAVAKYNPDNALALVVDPNNGEILAMASRPTYSPNNYKNYTTEVINRNLPVWATFEPGSTFKIVTFAAAIEEKKVDIFKDRFYDPGYVIVEGARIRCWNPRGHGSETFLQVLENSCNPGFVELGKRLGKETLFGYLEKLGFGEKTGVDLSGEGTGIIFKLEDVKILELVTTAFGQGVSVTPIQQVNAVSAIVNGGTLYQPYIVKRFLEPETNMIIKENNKKIIRNNIISQETSNLVNYALESVVSNGTGRTAYVEEYRVGGKTGTAQKVKDGRYMDGNYIMSFVATVPADKPKAVLYVAIDNPKGVAQLASITVTPIAKKMLIDIINALDIEKDDTGLGKIYQPWERKYYEVPNVIGMEVKKAMPLLRNFRVEFSGSGDIIIEQSPKGKERLISGGKLRLLLGK